MKVQIPGDMTERGIEMESRLVKAIIMMVLIAFMQILSAAEIKFSREEQKKHIEFATRNFIHLKNGVSELPNDAQKIVERFMALNALGLGFSETPILFYQEKHKRSPTRYKDIAHYAMWREKMIVSVWEAGEKIAIKERMFDDILIVGAVSGYILNLAAPITCSEHKECKERIKNSNQNCAISLVVGGRVVMKTYLSWSEHIICEDGDQTGLWNKNIPLGSGKGLDGGPYYTD